MEKHKLYFFICHLSTFILSLMILATEITYGEMWSSLDIHPFFIHFLMILVIEISHHFSSRTTFVHSHVILVMKSLMEKHNLYFFICHFSILYFPSWYLQWKSLMVKCNFHPAFVCFYTVPHNTCNGNVAPIFILHHFCMFPRDTCNENN